MTNLGRNTKTPRAGLLENEWIFLPRARLGRSLPQRCLDSHLVLQSSGGPRRASGGRVSGLSAHHSPREAGELLGGPRSPGWGWPSATGHWEGAVCSRKRRPCFHAKSLTSPGQRHKHVTHGTVVSTSSTPLDAETHFLPGFPAALVIAHSS